MIPANTLIKDPNSTLDYAIDWSEWLGEDTVTTSTWAATGVTIVDTPPPSHTAGVSTVWVSGGTVGAKATVTNSIVTAAGRRDDRTIHLTVIEK